MKTYTIRQLEWKIAAETMIVAEAFGEYVIQITHGRKFKVWFEGDQGSRTIRSGLITEAAAKELAWQDWLRRITPALEEIK